MSQDVEAQTPICSLLRSGGRRSPQKPHSVSRRAHMLYVHTAETQQEGRGLGSERAGREITGLGKGKSSKGKHRRFFISSTAPNKPHS